MRSIQKIGQFVESAACEKRGGPSPGKPRVETNIALVSSKMFRIFRVWEAEDERPSSHFADGENREFGGSMSSPFNNFRWWSAATKSWAVDQHRYVFARFLVWVDAQGYPFCSKNSCQNETYRKQGLSKKFDSPWRVRLARGVGPLRGSREPSRKSYSRIARISKSFVSDRQKTNLFCFVVGESGGFRKSKSFPFVNYKWWPTASKSWAVKHEPSPVRFCAISQMSRCTGIPILWQKSTPEWDLS